MLNIFSTSATIGPLSAATLYVFAVCSQSILAPPQCSPFPPAEQSAAALEPVAFLEAYFVTATAVGLRWPPPTGPPPAAYKVTMVATSGLEAQLGGDVEGAVRNYTATGLTSNNTYSFRVYPLSPAAGGRFYSPTSPPPPTVTPVPAPTATTLACSGSAPCTGTDLKITWTPARGVNAALSHRVTATQWSGGPPNGANSTLEYSFAYTVPASDPLQIAEFTSLARGVPLTVAIEAQSSVRTAYYAPSASFRVVPTSPPGPPSALGFSVVNNSVVRVTWRPPLDSGDGTPTGVFIDSYVIEYSASGGPFTAVPTASPTSLTRDIVGLAPGSTYTIRVSARGLPPPGEACLSGVCASLSLPSEYGPATSGKVLVGSVPVWVNGSAPPRREVPELFKLFVGTRFEYPLSAVGLDAGQMITISAAGLIACGARLVDIVVGNPAAATLRMDPSLREMDKT